MKVLLDENVPIQTLDLLRRVLRGHDVDHVDPIQWKGKKDLFLCYPTLLKLATRCS